MPYKTKKDADFSTSFCLFGLWELTDSTGVAEAGIPLKINIFLFPQPPLTLTPPISKGQRRDSCEASCFFVEGGENLFSCHIQQKREIGISNLSSLKVGVDGFEPPTLCL